MRNFNAAHFVFVGATLLLLGAVAMSVYSVTATQETLAVTILDKERIVETGQNGSVSSKYLVFTDGEVFENTDSLLMFKFNSSDVQGEMQVGSLCELKVYGWRIPFLSMYRNIAEANCVER
jgi:hypothetical protein